MRITKIQPKQNNNSVKYKSIYMPKFGAHYDNGRIKELVGDGLIYRSGHIHNYSCLLRDFRLFLEIPEILKEKFPNGVKIYDYCCSAGYEPVSIVLGLFNSFSKEKVNDYTPIIARDNNPDIIRKAREYKLILEQDEIRRLSFFENINPKDFLTAKRIDIHEQRNFDYTKDLKEKIHYETADIFKDLESGKLSNEPCVLFIRNMWQYLTSQGVSKLSYNLYSGLAPKSMVIIGSHDIENQADKALIRAGFNKMKGDYNIDFKDRLLQAKYEDSKYWYQTNDFCFEK